MNKVYQRINWENYPNDATPLSAQNLNRLDMAADELDNRLIAMDTVKMDKATAATMVKDIAYNEETGSFTVTYLDGSSYTLDTKLEKLAVNVTYDPAAEQLVILLDDGTTQHVDLSALVTEHEFLDSDTVGFTVDETGAVRAQLRDGSVTEEKLRPDYLSDIRMESAKAQAAGAAAAENAAQAEGSASAAESYAKGGTGTRPGEDTDNALYYSSLAETQADRAKAEADRAASEILDRVMTEETAGIGRPDGVTITVDEEGVLTASVAGKTSDLENDSGFAVAAELTRKEYDTLPEEKLTDGKLYLVRDAAGDSGQLIRNGVYYGADRDLRERLGTADISAVGDGTVTGAISELNTDISRFGKLLFRTDYDKAFRSGAITVPGISNYRTYIGYFYAAQASPMIGFHTGNVIVFTGTLITAETPVVARTTLIPSGDTVTFLNGEGIIQIYGLF